MPTVVSPIPIEPADLPSMLATLYSYESWLGPYHPQTLRLMAQVAIGYWQAGEAAYARPLLEEPSGIWAAILAGSTLYAYGRSVLGEIF